MATEADYKRIGNYARMYNKDQNADRSKATRKVPLEVLCLGYSRTGTLTMHKACEILGYPNPYHFSSFYDNVQESDLWMQAINAKFYGKGEMPDKAFFDGVLGHVGATTDAPVMLFGKELVEFYPDAKVVLVERNIDSWYKSWMSFCQSAYDPMLYRLAELDPYWMKRITLLGGSSTKIEAGFSETIEEAAVRSKDAYRHHYRDVREYVPKERLLEFNLADGWGPLCEFLGKPIPDVPFPHENDTESNRQSFVELGQMTIKRIVVNATTALTVIAVPLAAVYYYRRVR